MLRALTVRLALVAGLALAPDGARGQSGEALRITFLDVGQGDAVLVRAPEGQTALIDAGPGRDIVPVLRALDVEQVDLLVASHPHADHIGGMLGVLNALTVRFFMDNSYGHPGFQAVAAYGSMASEIHRTDQEGSITVKGFADGTYRVSGEHLVPAGGRTPAPPAPPTTSAAVGQGLSVGVFADAPGNDHQNRNGEYAFVRNGSASGVDVSGWTLCDAARHCFRFPDGVEIAPEGRLVVFTGAGVSDGVRFFMNSGSAVWNNNGDTATLTDATGRVVARYVYD